MILLPSAPILDAVVFVPVVESLSESAAAMPEARARHIKLCRSIFLIKICLGFPTTRPCAIYVESEPLVIRTDLEIVTTSRYFPLVFEACLSHNDEATYGGLCVMLHFKLSATVLLSRHGLLFLFIVRLLC